MSHRQDRRMDRREALKVVGGGALALASFRLRGLAGDAPAAGKPRKRVLFFTRSQTYEHDVVKRNGNDLGFCEKILVDLGPKHGFEVRASKDGRLFSDPANIATYDAFIFYTSGVLTLPGGDKQPPMTPAGKAALLEAISSGKGFVGIHAADDSFHSNEKSFQSQPEEKRDPYIRMIGGEFISHGPQQAATLTLTDPKFPGCEALGPALKIQEEWYAHGNFAPDLHVIQVLETKGMQGEDYQRPPFPATWARKHGKGRVFYTSLGHREDVWTSAPFQSLLLGGIAWALGEVDAEVKPNLAEAAPESSKLPPGPKPPAAPAK